MLLIFKNNMNNNDKIVNPPIKCNVTIIGSNFKVTVHIPNIACTNTANVVNKGKNIGCPTL